MGASPGVTGAGQGLGAIDVEHVGEEVETLAREHSRKVCEHLYMLFQYVLRRVDARHRWRDCWCCIMEASFELNLSLRDGPSLRLALPTPSGSR